LQNRYYSQIHPDYELGFCFTSKTDDGYDDLKAIEAVLKWANSDFLSVLLNAVLETAGTREGLSAQVLKPSLLKEMKSEKPIVIISTHPNPKHPINH
jgi:hypothetical protein